MATRPKGFGMTAELAAKKAAKFDLHLANEAFDWIKEVLRFAGGEGAALADTIEPIEKDKDVQTYLKDGVILCHLINAIKPGSVKKINDSKMAFKQMENISNFLTACEKVGIKPLDLFQTVDVYEGTNINQVINGIFAIGRKAHRLYDGPALGPEEATENKREFTEEQLRAGEGVIGLQAGSNKGASQAGQNFGKTRAIID
ncbi:myophilin [Hydra vulgaris]|uniref:Calponin n=1 Tax=Hydra vulgaris TaxID=6087 RepID=A0ABM4CXP9_HYDVU|nr:myophilin [Hydra vulgaris]